NMANAEQAPAMASPVRTDEQIVPRNRWILFRSHIQTTTGCCLLLPTPDTLVEFVNKLRYPKEVIHLSNSTTNDMFQPWRALTTIINLCLTERLPGFGKAESPSALTNSLGVVNRLTSTMLKGCGKNLPIHPQPSQRQKGSCTTHSGKKKATLILIPSIRFTKLIIFHLQRLHNFHPRPESPLHLPTEELGTKVTKHQRYIAGEELSDPESPAPKPAKPTKQAKPKATEQPTVSKTKAKKSKPAPAKPQKKKRKPVSESSEAPPLAKHAKAGKVVKKRTVKSSKLEESLTDAYPTQMGPLPHVVFRETDTGKFQPLPEVPGKGKEKTFSPPTEIQMGLKMKPDGSEPCTRDEGQAGPNPDDVAESLPLPTPGVLAGPNLKHSEDEIN
ncbi:hypothetical protein Tco_0987584, partial [Tanacetum coccineum]